MPVSSAPQRLQGGQAVLNYKVLRELGSRSAPVYAAHRTTGARVELAVLQHFRRSRDASSQLTGILRDARAVAEIKHPSLMRVFGADPVGEEIVVASEFVEGEAYGSLLAMAREREMRVPLEARLRVLLDLLAGLGALHMTKDARRRVIGLYHGLVSPVDVLVGLDGVTRVIGVFHSLPLRVASDALPHIGYFAPEVLLGDRVVDRRADLYGVGVMLWEALAGKRLFPDKNEGQILSRHLQGPLERPELAGELAWAAPLVDVALRALATDAKVRFDTAEDMAAAIQAHAKLAPQTTVAMLVRQLAGERILRRRGEFAADSAEPVRATQQSSASVSVTDIEASEQAATEKGDDTVTKSIDATAAPAQVATPTASVEAVEDEPSEDSITKLPPQPAPMPEYSDDESDTTLAPIPEEARPRPAGAPPKGPARDAQEEDEEEDCITATAARVPAEQPVSAPTMPRPEPPRPSTHLAPTTRPARTKSSPGVEPPPTTPDEPDDSPTEANDTQVQAEPPATMDAKKDGSVARANATIDVPKLGENEDLETLTKEVETITRELETLPREIPKPFAKKKQPSIPKLDAGNEPDDDEEDEEAVTEIAPAPMNPVLPRASEESITQDRPLPPSAQHAVAAASDASRGVRASAASLSAFPPLSALPVGPAPAAPPPIFVGAPLQQRVVEVHAHPVDALGETVVAPPSIPMLTPGVEEPLPSYRGVGIALGFAVVAALALFVYVIVRAAHQNEAYEAEQASSAEVRSKAKHDVHWEEAAVLAPHKNVTPAGPSAAPPQPVRHAGPPRPGGRR